jgi:hypothetical protein
MLAVVHGTPGMKYGLSERSTHPNSFLPFPIVGSGASTSPDAVKLMRACAIAFQDAIALRTASWTAWPSTVVEPVR